MDSLKQAERLADEGKWEECLGACERALLQDAESAAAHNLKGYCLVALGRLPEALPSFKLARLYLPMYPPIRYNLGKALMDTGQLEEARAEFDETLKLDSGHIPARLSRAMVRFQLGDAAGSLADLDECIRREPKSGHHWLTRAAYHAEKGDKTQALRDLEKALAVDPSCREDAGPLLDRFGDPQEKPGEQGLRQGEMFADEGSWLDALALADLAIERNPDSARALALKGRALTGMALLEKAEQLLLEALEKFPGEAQLHRLLAEARLRREDLWGALKAYDGALAAAPEDAESLRGRAALKMQLGDPEGAQSDLDRLKRL